MSKILIVDDESKIRSMVAYLLRAQDHETVEAENGLKALDLLDEADYDLIITDLRMPDMNGLALLEFARKRVPHVPVILVTAYASPETTRQAVDFGVFDYLSKPFRAEGLLEVVRRALAAGRDKTRAADGYSGNNPDIQKYLDGRRA